jgi:hypothetical protein
MLSTVHKSKSFGSLAAALDAANAAATRPDASLALSSPTMLLSIGKLIS